MYELSFAPLGLVTKGGTQQVQNHTSLMYRRNAYPDAKRSEVGFQAQMNTSDSCPRKTVVLLRGMVMLLSTSMSSCPVVVAVAFDGAAGGKKVKKQKKKNK